MSNDNQTTSRYHSPEEKIEILRLHLQDKIPISVVCEKNQINPTKLDQWQKTLFEKGAAAFAEETVPRATDNAFEKLANEVCDIAEMDREDRDYWADFFQKRMQKWWREFEPQMGTDQAQQRAIERFGAVESSAYSLHEGGVRRMFLYNSGQTARVLFFCGYLAMIYIAFVKFPNNNHDSDSIIQLFDSFYKVFLALACCYVVSRFRFVWSHIYVFLRINSRKPLFRPFRLAASWCPRLSLFSARDGPDALTFVKWFVLACILFASFQSLAIFLYPFIALKSILANQIGTKANIVLLWIFAMMWLFASMVLGFCAILSAASEIFDWPRLKREGNKTVIWCFYKLPLDLKDRYLPKLFAYLGIRPKGSVE